MMKISVKKLAFFFLYQLLILLRMILLIGGFDIIKTLYMRKDKNVTGLLLSKRFKTGFSFEQHTDGMVYFYS